MERDGVSIIMKTAPRMAFDVEEQEKGLEKVYETMEINDCDQPRSMELKLYKVRDSVIEVEFALDEYDINGPKKVLQIVLEYAILDKSYSKQKKKKKKSSKKKRRKGNDSSSDDSSDDSDDSDESDSSSDSDSSDEKSSSDDMGLDIDEKIEDIDINSLKWIENENKIKYKKHKRRNKYKIENLKENRAYLVRIRARNDSGFGPWSQIISALTPKCMYFLCVFQYISCDKTMCFCVY